MENAVGGSAAAAGGGEQAGGHSVPGVALGRPDGSWGSLEEQSEPHWAQRWVQQHPASPGKGVCPPTGTAMPTWHGCLRHPWGWSSETCSKSPLPIHPLPPPRREGGFGDMKESSTPKPAPSVKMFPGRCLGLLILWDQPRRRPRCLGRGGQTHPSPGNPLGTAEPFGHVADGLSTLGRQNAEQWRLQGVPWSLSPSLSHKGSRRFPPFPPAPALLPPLLSPSPSSFPAAG